MNHLIKLPAWPAAFAAALVFAADPPIERLRERLVELNDDAEKIQDTADREQRDLTANEQTRIDEIFNEFNGVEAELKRREQLHAQRASMASRTGRRTDANAINRGEGLGPTNRMPGRRGRALFKNATTGEPIQAFRHGEALSELPTEEPLVGQFLRAYVLGDMSLAPANIRASINTVDDGAVVPIRWSARFIDLARDASVCIAAGAETIELPGSEIRIGKLTSDPTVYWRGELAPVTSSKPTFGTVTMRPKVAAVLIPLSIEWAEDSINGPAIIEQTVSRVLGAAIDKAALIGSGTGAEPEGVITNVDEVLQRPAVGAPTNYDEITDAIGAILGQNYQGDVSALSWIRPPAVATFYEKLKTGLTGDQTPLMPPDWVKQLRKFQTNSILGTDSPNEHSQVVGDFREMLFGFRLGGVRIQLFNTGTGFSPDSPTDSLNALSQLAIWVRAFIRFDVAQMRPDFFAHLPETNVG